MSSQNPLPSCARSSSVPFIPGESHGDRHHRRKVSADEDAVRLWCASRDVALSIANDRHHWMLRGPGLALEWWPSSGRVVVDQRYDKPRKAHDCGQMLAIAGKHRRRRLNRKRRK